MMRMPSRRRSSFSRTMLFSTSTTVGWKANTKMRQKNRAASTDPSKSGVQRSASQVRWADEVAPTVRWFEVRVPMVYARSVKTLTNLSC